MIDFQKRKKKMKMLLANIILALILIGCSSSNSTTDRLTIQDTNIPVIFTLKSDSALVINRFYGISEYYTPLQQIVIFYEDDYNRASIVPIDRINILRVLKKVDKNYIVDKYIYQSLSD